MSTALTPLPPRRTFEDFWVADLGLGWPEIRPGTTFLLGPAGMLKGDGLYVVSAMGARLLRRVHWRMDGEVWLWEDPAPEATREIYSADEFDEQLRSALRPVVGRWVPEIEEAVNASLRQRELREGYETESLRDAGYRRTGS